MTRDVFCLTALSRIKFGIINRSNETDYDYTFKDNLEKI